MANEKFSGFPDATLPIGTSDTTVGLQGGVNVKFPAPQVITATVSLTANQVNHLFSSPRTIVAAPGSGKAILLASGYVANGAATVPSASYNVAAAPDPGKVYYGSSAGFALSSIVAGPLTEKLIGIAYGGLPTFAQIEDQALVISSIADFSSYGAILTATKGVGGAGYAPGDTGIVGNSTAIYVVDTADGGGAVLTFHISSAGYGYPVQNGLPTFVNDGGGDGNFTINITAITVGDSTAQVNINYQIITLP